MIEHELIIVVRGIYHNAVFANWWATQLLESRNAIQCAINARRIMSNNLSWVTADAPKMLHFGIKNFEFTNSGFHKIATYSHHISFGR
jgi:hypothetical protein